jgi:very-short-patch-repair endonuclease
LLEPFKYKNGKTKLHLKCNIDNNEWHPIYSSFINTISGCPECGNKRISEFNKLSQEEVLNNINKKCMEMGYSLVKPFIYENNKTMFYLKCKEDEHIWPTNHNYFIDQGNGCPKCAGKNKTQEEVEKLVLDRCIEMDYELIKPFVYKNCKTIFYLRCKKDGHEWPVSYNNFIDNETGCPRCCQSKGELKIHNYLKNENINFIQEHKFSNCKNILKLKFDFYLPDYNLCIEYDGIQHFEVQDFFGGEKALQNLQKNDNIKNEYCKNNNINIIRIRYDENIINKLNEIDFYLHN